MFCCHSIQDQLVCTPITSCLLHIFDYRSLNQFFILKKRWYLLINVSDPFFSDKSLKYCDDSESDKKWYLLSDVNSSNSSNLRNSVLSLNCRLHMYIKQQGPSWSVAQYFFMNKYDTLKNGGFRYNSRSTKIQCIKFAYHVALFVSKFSPVKG